MEKFKKANLSLNFLKEFNKNGNDVIILLYDKDGVILNEKIILTFKQLKEIFEYISLVTGRKNKDNQHLVFVAQCKDVLNAFKITLKCIRGKTTKFYLTLSDSFCHNIGTYELERNNLSVLRNVIKKFIKL